MTTLPETDVQLKTPEIDGLDRPPEAEPTIHKGSIVIRMDLAGRFSTEISASESATEELLRKRLLTASPILKQLHKAVNITCDPAGARG